MHGFFSSLKDGGELEVTDVQSIRVKIDGTEYEAPKGSKILDILNQNGIEIPQICHVPEVDPIQTCDTCIVEVNGKLRPLLFHGRRKRDVHLAYVGKGKRGSDRGHGPPARESPALLYGMR